MNSAPVQPMVAPGWMTGADERMLAIEGKRAVSWEPIAESGHMKYVIVATVLVIWTETLITTLKLTHTAQMSVFQEV
jgi:hypothetical protein